MSAERILILIIGLSVGVWLGWLWRALRRSTPDLRVEQELRSQLTARESELGQARSLAAETAARRAAAEAGRDAAVKAADERAVELHAAQLAVTAARDQLALVEARLAGARAELENGRVLLEEQRRYHAEQQRELRERHDEALTELRATNDKTLLALRDQFKALAADALAANGPEFLRLANETFARFQVTAEGDLTRRQANIASLVKPLEEQLKAYQQRLQQAESQQQSSLGQVTQHLEALAAQNQTLASETQRLRVVLSSGQARGRWGEETLRRVVEAAGLSAHCDFTEQLQEGERKPDLVVRLPGERVIIVDSKVPDLDFLGALGEADATRRRDVLVAHARKLRETIKELAGKEYPRLFANALDYVVLFLPAESLFSAALEGDRDLIVWAAERRVLLATPASLIALLRSVALSWQQQEQSENAQQIAAAAQQLYERVAKFTEHFEGLREGLNRANKAFDAAVGSYERSVRPSGERLVKLGGTAGAATLVELMPLEASLRLPPAAAAE